MKVQVVPLILILKGKQYQICYQTMEVFLLLIVTWGTLLGVINLKNCLFSWEKYVPFC